MVSENTRTMEMAVSFTIDSPRLRDHPLRIHNECMHNGKLLVSLHKKSPVTNRAKGSGWDGLTDRPFMSNNKKP